MRFFALLAALGLVLSTLAEAWSFFILHPETLMGYFWFLHLGIFAVWIPAVVLQPKPAPGQSRTWRQLVGDAPAWLRWLTVLIVVHAFLNTAAFEMVCGHGGPSQEPDGTFSISSHARIIRRITRAEYERASAYEFRSFSGWWMMFYSIALVIIISQINRRKRLNEFVPPARGHFAMPVWLHQSLLLFCLAFGWLGVPALTAAYILPLMGGFLGAWSWVFFLGSWVLGVTIPSTIWRRLVAARCPACGGRAFCLSLFRTNYRCIDCGHVEGDA